MPILSLQPRRAGKLMLLSRLCNCVHNDEEIPPALRKQAERLGINVNTFEMMYKDVFKEDDEET